MKILTLLLTGSCIIACNTTPENLVWSDEFDGTGQPDTTFWNYAIGNGCPNLCGWGNNEKEYYTNNNANIRIEDGLLVIEAIKLDSQWTSARINTRGKRNFTYGRIEFKAKLPSGTGTWPALWMLGESITEKGWPACGEIDIMEHAGRNAGVVQSAMHTAGSFGNTLNKGDIKVSDHDKVFHVYAADWTHDKIVFSVDGEAYYTYQPEEKDEKTWPFDSPFYIIINLAMGGGFGGPVDEDLTHARMEVEYVRVYE